MRTAIYAGTFDPITCGHMSVIERAAPLFDALVVLVAENPAKEPLFSLEERLAMIRESTVTFDNVRVDATRDLVVDYARRPDVAASVLVRGLRGASDADYETGLAHMNWVLAPSVRTLFVPAQAELSEVSSSRLKELWSRGEDVSRYAPAAVLMRLGVRPHTEEREVVR